MSRIIGYSDNANHSLKSRFKGYSDGTNHQVKERWVGGADGANHRVWSAGISATITLSTVSGNSSPTMDANNIYFVGTSPETPGGKLRATLSLQVSLAEVTSLRSQIQFEIDGMAIIGIPILPGAKLSAFGYLTNPPGTYMSLETSAGGGSSVYTLDSTLSASYIWHSTSNQMSLLYTAPLTIYFDVQMVNTRTGSGFSIPKNGLFINIYGGEKIPIIL